MDISRYDFDIQNLINDLQESRGKDSRMSIECGNRLLEYGIDRSEPELIGFARFCLGETYYLMNDIEKSYRQMSLCMEPFEMIHEWGYLTMANNLLGIMSLGSGNAPYAMDYYMQALSLCREYSLPDLEWMVHLNLAALYLDIADADNAIFHYQKGYGYLSEHVDINSYNSNLTVVCVGLGKASLLKKNYQKADFYNEMIERECIPHAGDLEKLVIYCFRAGLYHETGRDSECRECIRTIEAHFSEDVPVMEVFDDVYDFLELLLSMEEHEAFCHIMDHIKKPIETTRSRNLQKKHLTLLMKYYKASGQQRKYEKSGVEFFELSLVMDRENHKLILDTISLRHRLDDLTELTKEFKRENEVLLKKSETDPLTGIYNRQKLGSYGDKAFDRAIKNRESFAIEILDIDYFKEYNDNYGHQAGDRCIRYVAGSLMRLRVHPRVFCSRYGGDEFVLIYEGYSDREVFDMAKELKAGIVAGSFEHKYSKVDIKVVTVSQGIYWGKPSVGQSLWNYLHAADKLLYRVKKKSRNSILLGHAHDDTDDGKDELLIDE